MQYRIGSRWAALLVAALAVLGLSSAVSAAFPAPSAITTQIQQPICPTGTPTQIATPAFTPAPGCTDTPPPGTLHAVITDHPTTTDALFTNPSATCSYRIGLATYQKIDGSINHQVLYDATLAVIPPNSTMLLTVNNPACAYQGDAFYGDLIVSFAGGVRYGERRLDDTDGLTRGYCTITCPTPPAGSRTPTPIPPPPTNTRVAATRTATTVPTSTPALPTRTPTRVATNTPALPTRTATAVPTNTALPPTRTTTRTPVAATTTATVTATNTSLAATPTPGASATPTGTSTETPTPGAGGSWIVVSPMPQALYGVSMASDPYNYAYVAGGRDDEVSSPYNELFRYQPTTDIWTTLPSMPGGRYGASMIYYNNQLYVFGGYVAGSLHNRPAQYVTTDAILVYDIEGDSWTILSTTMPAPRAQMGVGLDEAAGKVYLTGGYSAEGAEGVSSQTWVYDINADSWTTLTPMLEARGGAAGGFLGGQVFVIGGADGTGTGTTTNQVYDIGSDTWSYEVAAPLTIYGAGTLIAPAPDLLRPAASRPNGMWICGSMYEFPLAGTTAQASGAPRTRGVRNDVQIRIPGLDTWELPGPALNVPRGDLGAARVGDYLITAGGEGADGTLDTTEILIVPPEETPTPGPGSSK